MRTCDECHSAVESARAVDRSFLEMTADAYTIAHRLALDLTIQDDPWNDKARKRALFRAFEMLASPPDDVLNVMHGPPFFQAGTYLEFILSFFSSFATDSSFADAKIHGESLPRLAFVNAGFFERFGESILAQMIEAFNLAISSKALRLSNDPARIIRGYADPDVVARIRNRIADMIFVIEQLHRLSDLVNVHTAQMRYEMTRTCVGAIFWLVAFLNVNVRASLSAANYLGVMQTLRDAPACQFEQLIDLCGMDYSTYAEVGTDGPRFGVVVHLLSVSLNQRVRVMVLCPDDDLPLVDSVNDLWNSANWYEREAFDLFGILFEGHLDLRRILTDFGFIGHPFRKDFPTSGHVEMRYDAEQKRVIYQPVTIEPREITPRIVREDNYGGLH